MSANKFVSAIVRVPADALDDLQEWARQRREEFSQETVAASKSTRSLPPFSYPRLPDQLLRALPSRDDMTCALGLVSGLGRRLLDARDGNVASVRGMVTSSQAHRYADVKKHVNVTEERCYDVWLALVQHDVVVHERSKLESGGQRTWYGFGDGSGCATWPEYREATWARWYALHPKRPPAPAAAATTTRPRLKRHAPTPEAEYDDEE